MVSLEEARAASLRCDSYSRMGYLIEVWGGMNRADWLRLVGSQWSCCDNIGQHRLMLRWLLPEEGPIPELMDPDERAAYDALPDRLTVYRGCGPHNMLGLSWSLDQQIAARFPFLNRYRQGDPMLVTGKVRKHHVLALKLDRDEAEVITFRARRVAVEPLPQVPALLQEVA
jgi:hypothetical protein